MKGVETNILVRYFTRDDPAQARAVARFVDSARASAEPLFVNLVVLCELVWVLGRSYSYSRAEIAMAISRLLTTEQVIVEDADLAWLALSDFEASQADFSDCLIGRKNLRHGCDTTATFDGRLKGLATFMLLPAAQR